MRTVTTKSSSLLRFFGIMALWAVMAWGWLCPVTAQNNIYKIPDHLYAIYQRAYSNRLNEKGLAISDTLYRRAVAEGNAKAQCLALTIPQLYYFNKDLDQENQKECELNLKRMTEATDRIKNAAVELKQPTFYYYACGNMVIYLLNYNKHFEAMEYVSKTSQMARQQKSVYGIYNTTTMLGNVFLAREEYKMAKKNFLDAIKYAEENHLDHVDVSAIYTKIARCGNQSGDYENALKYGALGMKVAKSKSTWEKNAMELCIAYFFLNKEKEFLELYPKLENVFYELDNSKNTRFWMVKMMYFILKERYVDALWVTYEEKGYAPRLYMQSLLYERVGKYRNALLKYRKYRTIQDSVNSQVTSNELVAQDVRIGNQRLLEEKHQMEIQKALLDLKFSKMSLKNSELEISHLRSQEEMALISSQNNALKFKNKTLEAEKQKVVISQLREKQREQMNEARTKHRLTVSVMLAMAILLLLTAVYLYYHVRMSKKLRMANSRLQKRNQQIAEARQQAEHADRMKTLFMQNMSHEIRTPLNAIVGFSQVLTKMGDSMSEAEKADVNHRVEESSELLLNLINDILDLTALESGKYKMKNKEVNVNDMCRMTIETVMHRVPAGVNLIFTTEAGDDMRIVTDDNRVKQVLINFLTNAEKNTTEGEIRLHCSLTENEGFLSFAVSDTGIGIAPEKMDEIFERFKKLDDFKQGAGLGLNICQTIAERLDGKVYIDKRYTHGARFVLAIPMKLAGEEGV